MNKAKIQFLQILTALIGIVVLIFLLWMPTVEGRNVDATLFEIYFNDPFLAFVYVGSVSFFVGVYQVFKILGLAKKGKLTSTVTLKALQTIKYCSLVLIVFALIGEVYIFTSISDDRAGGVAMGLLVIFGSVMVAVVAALLQRYFQKGLKA